MRSRTCAGLVCVFGLLATPVAAQPTTEDGIRAMLQGDYQTAVRILTPAAASPTSPNPVAQFLLAVLYDTGYGVKSDPSRACGFFQRAAAQEHPFATQAALIANLRQQHIGPLCTLDHRSQVLTSPTSVLEPSPHTFRTDQRTDTVAGVVALAAGDYSRAVEILEQIAEDWRGSDPAAQFVMAGLYETGRGVPLDPLRACALYMRAAASTVKNPFSRAADTLFTISAERSAEFNTDCQTLARVGFDHGFVPVTFHLGPGHSVEWTLGAVTVTYEGRTKRSEIMYAPPGARFLPLRYIELPVGPTRSLTRHFVEIFLWERAGGVGPWNLRWQLFEIVRDEIIRIDPLVEPLATADGDAPPSREAFDVREYAVLRVDSDGNAEWAVLKGAHARSARIESDAERQEVRAEALARDAALKRVDWGRRPDVYRHPEGTYVGADGCGHIQVYGWTAGYDEAIVIRIAARDLGLSTPPATFDLARQFANISVEAHVFNRPQRHFQFCSDVGGRIAGELGPEKWRAVAGTITIEQSPPGIRARAPHLRRATVTLTGLVLRNATGKTVTVPHVVKLTAIVGSMMGG